MIDVNVEHLKWISRLLLKALASARFSSLVIEPRIYITGPSFPIPEIAGVEDAESIEESGINSPVSPTAEQSIDKPGPPLYSALKIKHGRPSIPRILHEVISSSSGSVSVDGKSPVLNQC